LSDSVERAWLSGANAFNLRAAWGQPLYKRTRKAKMKKKKKGFPEGDF